MSAQSDIKLLVLHALRLKSSADVSTISKWSGLQIPALDVLLEQCGQEGLAKPVQLRGHLNWMLTQAGRAEGQALLAAELQKNGIVQQFTDAYQRFRSINSDVLAACTDWQVRLVNGQQLLNDHSDSGYDRQVVDRLGDLNSEIQPTCLELAELLLRMSHYASSLDAALERIREGETRWFTKPLIASYHTLWFELHEDFLASLGLDRTSKKVS